MTNDFLTDDDIQATSDGYRESEYIGLLWNEQGHIILVVEGEEEMYPVRIGSLQAGILADLLTKMVDG